MRAGQESRFRRVGEELVHRGPLIEVVTAAVEAPGGEVLQRQIVHHPGAVVVVPVEGDVAILVRQYRAAIDDELLEVPAGKRDVPGEAPERTALRELAEEVGRSASRLTLLARFYNSPGFSDELSYCFLAQGLGSAEISPQSLEEQHSTLVEVPLADVPGMIASGTIVDAKTIIGLALARQVLA
ncbi:MAG: NUDIX hydrolase [Acidimicrobiales bacterium]